MNTGICILPLHRRLYINPLLFSMILTLAMVSGSLQQSVMAPDAVVKETDTMLSDTC